MAEKKKQEAPDTAELPEEQIEPETSASQETSHYPHIAAIRAQALTPHKTFEPLPGVKLRYGHGGSLARVHGGIQVHVATAAELEAMSDEHLHEAIHKAVQPSW